MIVSFLLGFILGLFAFIGYGAYRAVGSDGWDDSNVLNWLRLLSHCIMHPEDFARMFYLTEEQEDLIVKAGQSPERPFDYISKDEFSENFPYTRPRV